MPDCRQFFMYLILNYFVTYLISKKFEICNYSFFCSYYFSPSLGFSAIFLCLEKKILSNSSNNLVIKIYDQAVHGNEAKNDFEQ